MSNREDHAQDSFKEKAVDDDWSFNPSSTEI